MSFIWLRLFPRLPLLKENFYLGEWRVQTSHGKVIAFSHRKTMKYFHSGPNVEERICFPSYRHFIVLPDHNRIKPPLRAVKNQDNDPCQPFMSPIKALVTLHNYSLFFAKAWIAHCLVVIPLNRFSFSIDLARFGLACIIQVPSILQNPCYSLISDYMPCTELGFCIHYCVQFSPRWSRFYNFQFTYLRKNNQWWLWKESKWLCLLDSPIYNEVIDLW